jgi:hypothetical protein
MSLRSFEQAMDALSAVRNTWYTDDGDRLHVSFRGKPWDNAETIKQLKYEHDVTQVGREDNADGMPINIYESRAE